MPDGYSLPIVFISSHQEHTGDQPAALPLAGPAARGQSTTTLMILPQVHLRKPCYDFYFL